MFGDHSEKYIERYEELLETNDIESLLEQEDLSLADALYLLFEAGHVRSPFEIEA